MNADARPLTVPDLLAMKAAGRRIVMLTCYDAAFARLLEQADVDVLLVGDSLNQVLAGHETTLSATLDQMIYHAGAVRRGARRVAGLRGSAVPHLPGVGRPKRSGTPAACCRRAARTASSSRAAGRWRRRCARWWTAGIPVIGHLGLTPQSVHALGGYRVQGRERPRPPSGCWPTPRALEEAGACAIVLELLPAALARADLGRRSPFPPSASAPASGCDGQVLVLHDMLGLNEGFNPKFLKRYAELGEAVRGAVRAYAAEVREGTYPGPEHSFE